jgi:large subunit ribosomal protein L24
VPFDKWRIVRGDRVQVISGKNKGSRGEVKMVIRKRNQVIVEGVNLVKKHQAGTSKLFF